MFVTQINNLAAAQHFFDAKPEFRYHHPSFKLNKLQNAHLRASPEDAWQVVPHPGASTSADSQSFCLHPKRSAFTGSNE